MRTVINGAMEPCIVFIFLGGSFYASQSYCLSFLLIIVITFFFFCSCCLHILEDILLLLLFNFSPFLFGFCRMTRAHSVSKLRQRVPANRCTNAVRSIWPFSVSSRCRGRYWRPRRPPPLPAPTPMAIKIALTASVANFWNWAEPLRRRRSTANRNLKTIPPRSSGGCHRGATNEESSMEPVTVSLFPYHFFFLLNSLSLFLFSLTKKKNSFSNFFERTLLHPLFIPPPSIFQKAIPINTYNHAPFFFSFFFACWSLGFFCFLFGGLPVCSFG